MAILVAVFGGSFFGSFLGPLLLEEWRNLRRDRPRIKVRKKLTRELFEKSSAPLIGLDDISRTIGSDYVETREVLVSMGAMGGKLPDGQEAWGSRDFR